MSKLETSVCAVCDPSLQRIEQIISTHYSQLMENLDLLSELKVLLHNIPKYVNNWTLIHIDYMEGEVQLMKLLNRLFNQYNLTYHPNRREP